MKVLEYSYDPHRKNYYINNHESSYNIKYRNDMIKYYFAYEKYCYR